MLLLPGREVMEKCSLIYGRTIVDRTWRKWKASIGLPGASPRTGEWLTEFQVKCMIVLAYLKHQNPWKHYTQEDVLIAMAKLRRDDEQWKFLIAIAIAPRKALLAPCRGVDLPKTLEEITGCKVNPRRLYRIAKRKGKTFSTEAFYNTNQINWWVDQLVA